ncbi:hypothetical protein NQ314_006051 [Rhamnusium bicolor]|uniref:DNA repair protein SWI5 homolog n=1 Tax=Rhamnusium bicolor TaxID=1586634 RepID=A0AAV8Z8S8_9CUCU|nr:hypothetical protein NQ314_006051 [Rhamnusium bicolor]
MDCSKNKLSTKSRDKKLKKSVSKENLSYWELKGRYEKLLKENSQLDKEIAELEGKGVTTDLQPQMQALHEYNEMKDLAQMIFGYLADAEQVTVSELHRRYNLPME